MDIEDFKKEEISKKLDFLAKAYTLLHNEVVKRRLPGEDWTLNQITKLLQEISKIAHNFSQQTEQRECFKMPDEFVELIGTMRFIAKRMDGIEKRFNDFELNHKVKITLDTTELDRFNNREKADDPYDNLLNSIPPREAKILVLRYGLYGDKKNNSQIANVMGMTREKVGVLKRKALSRCAYLRQQEWKRLPEGELKAAIEKQL